MKFSIAALLSVLILASACTPKAPSLEDEALKLGQQKFEEVIKTEAETYIKNSEALRESYISFHAKNTEYQLSTNQAQGDMIATVVVNVKGFTPPIRKALAEIAGSLPPTRTQRFNFAEAIEVMGKQMGTRIKPQVYPFKVYKFNKTAAGSWVPEF